jgi:hypothetical protein
MMIAREYIVKTAVLVEMFIILSYQRFVSLPTVILRMIVVAVSLAVHSTRNEPINQILIQLRII